MRFIFFKPLKNLMKKEEMGRGRPRAESKWQGYIGIRNWGEESKAKLEI